MRQATQEKLAKVPAAVWPPDTQGAWHKATPALERIAQSKHSMSLDRWRTAPSGWWYAWERDEGSTWDQDQPRWGWRWEPSGYDGSFREPGGEDDDGGYFLGSVVKPAESWEAVVEMTGLVESWLAAGVTQHDAIRSLESWPTYQCPHTHGVLQAVKRLEAKGFRRPPCHYDPPGEPWPTWESLPDVDERRDAEQLVEDEDEAREWEAKGLAPDGPPDETFECTYCHAEVSIYKRHGFPHKPMCSHECWNQYRAEEENEPREETPDDDEEPVRPTRTMQLTLF